MNLISKSRWLWVITICLLLLPLVSVAQTGTTGDLAGTVKDATDAIIPNAKVTLKNWDTGEIRTLTSSSAGTFRFTFLKPGAYQVSAETPGLKSDFSRVEVEVGQAANVELIAKVQSTQTVVEVNDSAAIIQTENANQATTFSKKELESQPMPGGDITSVAYTVAGIVMSTGGYYGDFSSHGLPGTSNLFTVNGNDNMDPYLNLNNSGASNLTLGQNEIAEAAVVQNGYSVQYGRQAGAQVNYITKSGTNGFHGNTSYQWNGDRLNANDFFNNLNGIGRPRAISNQWGAGLGGPVIKNKTFFYINDEGMHYVLPASGYVVSPSPQLQDYILGTVTAAQKPLYQSAFALWNNAPGASRAVPTTNGNGPLQDAYGNLGCGQGTFGAANGMTTAFGDTVPCTVGYATNGSNLNKEQIFVARVDQNVGDKQKLSFRYKQDHGLQPTSTDLVDSTFSAVSNQPSYEGQFTHTYVISPTLVNNFIGSSSWYSALFSPANLQKAYATFPVYLLFEDGVGTNAAGLTSLGVANNMPQGRRVGQLQLTDDVSKTAGKHTIKFGVNYRYNRVTDTSYSERAVAGEEVLYDFTDFVTGQVNSTGSGSFYNQRFAEHQAAHLRLGSLGIYAQDEWALSSKVKVSYGLRVDHNSNPDCVDDCFSRMIDPFSSAAFVKDATLPYNQSIQVGLSQAFKSTQALVYQPRVSLVATPFSKSGTVIRSGFGIFSDLSPGQLTSNIFNNSPNVFSPSVKFGSISVASDPTSAQAAALATNNAFQTGFANGSTLAQIQSSLAPVAFTPPAYYSVPNEFKVSRYAEWSFEIQQPLGQKNVLTLTYSGNHGSDLYITNAKVNAFNAAGFGGLPTSVADPRFRIITEATNNGISNYDGLSASFRRAFSYGFSGQVSYTWSHALDDVSNGGVDAFSGDSLLGYNNPSNFSNNYGNADYDIRHNVVADFVWDVPFKSDNKVLKAALSGWTLSSKMYFRGGTPFSIWNGSLAAHISNAMGGSMLANVIGAVPASCGKSAIDTPCFSASEFSTTSSQTGFSDQTRNMFRGPGYSDLDAQLMKKFSITERVSLTLGASALNLFNHPNFANPAQNVAGGGLGYISSTVVAPSSPYGSFQGSAVSGRLLVLQGHIRF